MKTLKNKLVTALICVCLITGSATDKAHAESGSAFDRIMQTKTINCGYFVWAPYVLKDANTGKMSGINVDIMEAVARNLGLKINWKTEVGIGDIGDALQTNKIDMMCASLWPTAGRFSGMMFSGRPEFYSKAYAVVRKDDKRFEDSLDKANNQSVTVTGIEGDFSSELATELLPDAKHDYLSSMASPAEFMMQLVTKKADILFIDKGGVNDFEKTNPGQLRVVEKLGPVRIYGEHLAYKRGDFELRDMIDMSLLQLANDGIIGRLVQKYAAEYKTDIQPSAKDIRQ